MLFNAAYSPLSLSFPFCHALLITNTFFSFTICYAMNSLLYHANYALTQTVS